MCSNRTKKEGKKNKKQKQKQNTWSIITTGHYNLIAVISIVLSIFFFFGGGVGNTDRVKRIALHRVI